MTRLALLLAIALALLLVACGQEKAGPPPRPTATPTLPQVTRTVPPGSNTTDALGRTVRIPEGASRVIALSPSAAEFAVALGLQVIGRTSDISFPAVQSAPETGSTLSPDFNAVDALNPDLVIADATYHSGRTRDFDQFPHPVYVIQVDSYEDVLSTLDALGNALGRAEQAEAGIERIESSVEALRRGLAGRPRPGVLVVSGSGRDVYAASAATYIGSLLTVLGATNVYAEAAEGAPLPGFGVIEITEANADIRAAADLILVIPGGQGDPAAGIIAASTAWAGTRPVTEGRIHELDHNLFLRSPGPSAIEALEVLAALLYP